MIDTTKPVQTTRGLKARIVCTDVAGDQPILALFKDADGREHAYFYYSDGLRHADGTESPLDLVNVPKQTVRYVGITGHGLTSIVSIAQPSARDFKHQLKLTYEGEKLVKAEIVE